MQSGNLHPDPSPIVAAFSAQLRGWRERTGITLAAAAKGFGVSMAAVHQWEHGGRFPSADHLDAIARVTGIPACCLVHDPEGCCPIATRKTAG